MSSSSDQVVRDALALREWARRALAGEATAAPRTEDERAWTVFLATERIALRLVDHAAARALPPRARAVLAAQARGELLKVAAARAQLARIGRWSAARGGRVVALKGGAALARGDAAIVVDDVDVLCAEPDALALVAMLDAEGFRPLGTASAQHLAPRVAPGSVAVEAHVELPTFRGAALVLADAQPVARLAGIAVPAPADHLWQLLVHNALQHPQRRGTLRELVLGAEALARCDERGRAAVDEAIARHPRAALLRSVREELAALAGRRLTSDPFRATTAVSYLLAARHQRLRPLEWQATRLANLAIALLSDGADRAAFLRALGGGLELESPRPFLAWAQARLPRAGRLLRAGARVAAVLPMVPLALRTARDARRLAREAGPRLDAT